MQHAADCTPTRGLHLGVEESNEHGSKLKILLDQHQDSSTETLSFSDIAPYSSGPISTSVTLTHEPSRDTASISISCLGVAQSRSPRHAFHVPYHGRWEGLLQDLCDIIDTPCHELVTAEIAELQCRKQMIGIILHRFLVMRLRTPAGAGDGSEDIYLRLDRRADPNARIGRLIRTGATDANDCVSHILFRNSRLCGHLKQKYRRYWQ